MKPSTLSDRQCFELELEQLKAIYLLENEEMWAQRVVDEAAGSVGRMKTTTAYCANTFQKTATYLKSLMRSLK